jgi:hypothetical protein
MFHGFRSLIQLPSLFSCSEGASVPHPRITVRALPVYPQVIPKNRRGGEAGTERSLPSKHHVFSIQEDEHGHCHLPDDRANVLLALQQS